MLFPRSARSATRLIWLDEAKSTNDELASRARGASPEEWPDFSVVLTDHQTFGKGRLGRSWTAPQGTMLAISILIRPSNSGIFGDDGKGWIPLMAGLAMTRALRTLGAATELKWPNDVLIEDRKVCGILAEAHAGGVVIVGSGVNLSLSESQLPVPTATSMLIAGAETDPDLVLSGYLTELRVLYRSFAQAGGDAERSGVRSAVSNACSTLGRPVRVQLPGAADLIGVAEELDGTGRLVVVDSDGRRTAVSAGDVTHLRY